MLNSTLKTEDFYLFKLIYILKYSENNMIIYFKYYKNIFEYLFINYKNYKKYFIEIYNSIITLFFLTYIS